jgi:hypothetical protein
MMQNMMDGCHMSGGMMLGMGLFGLLALLVLVLSITGLTKYIFFR